MKWGGLSRMNHQNSVFSQSYTRAHIQLPLNKEKWDELQIKLPKQLTRPHQIYEVNTCKVSDKDDDALNSHST